MTSCSTFADGSLGAADVAALVRLRACALCLATANPEGNVDTLVRIALHWTVTGGLQLLAPLAPVAARHLCCAAGWNPTRMGLVSGGRPVIADRGHLARFAQLIADAEIPAAGHAGLRSTVRSIGLGEGVASKDAATLAAVGWKLATRAFSGRLSRCLVPAIPAAPSAHEVIESLLACEGGGLGDGPVGRLARAAIDRLGAGGGR